MIVWNFKDPGVWFRRRLPGFRRPARSTGSGPPLATVLILTLVSLALPVSESNARTATPDDPYRIIGVVWRGETEVEAGFRAQLTQRRIPFELEILNLALDRKNAPAFVEEIKRKRPDLVYTWGTGTTTSIVGPIDAENPDSFVRDIPGLFVLVSYPLQANIIESFERTGRNLTGVSFLAPVDVQFSAIQAYYPFKTVAVIYDETAQNSRINVERLKVTVPEMGMRLLVYPIPLDGNGRPDPEEMLGLVAVAREDGAELLYIGPDSFLVRHADALTSTAIEAGLPTFSATQAPLLNSRAMFGLVSDYFTHGRLAALQAERILVDGIAPEDLPVGELTRYKLWINHDVVHEVGLYPPLALIAVADFRESPR
ncbi:MAG: ABC transporter substrate-binding protein [Paracoccaceae bacterium]|nr:ABC transporter substrate-binding protein [Paracoccaceae bacterium]